MADQDDAVVQAFGQITNRRNALRGVLGLVAGSAVALAARNAGAARRGYGGPGASDPNDAPVLNLSFIREAGACRCWATVANAPPSTSGTVEIYNDSDERRWGSIRMVTSAAGRGIGKLDVLVPQGTVWRGHANIQGVEFDSASTTSCS